MMERRAKFLRNWGISLGASVGVVSGFATFIPAEILTVAGSGAVLATCTLGSAVFAWRRTKPRQLPVEEIGILSTPREKVRCRVECPASRSLVEQASALAHGSFGRIDAVPTDRYDSWRLKNPNILACLLNSTGEVVGYFDILPLTSTFMDRFIRGDVTELDIRHEDILSPQHARRCKRLYIAGIAVRDPDTFTSQRHTCHLVWALAKYLEHFYGIPSDRQVYALGGTKAGRHLLERFNFRKVQEPSKRRDAQALYVTSLTDPETVANIDVDIGNWSQACRLSWQEPARLSSRRSVS